MDKLYKIVAGIMVCILLAVSMPVEGRTEDGSVDSAKEGRAGIEKCMQSPEVTEVADLQSFVTAVENMEMVLAENESEKIVSGNEKVVSGNEEVAVNTKIDEGNPWQSKCLLVKSPEGFDTKGAVSVIQGFDQIFVLYYASEEETRQAYEYLKNISYLQVEPDAIVCTAQELQTGTENAEYRVSGKTEGTEEVLVAVIDSGYDIAGCGTERILAGEDFTGSDSVQDSNGHGTAMANLILDHSGNSVKVMPIKAADGEGRSSSLKIYLAIRYAMEKGADIINISMSAYKPSDNGIIKNVIDEAVSNGIAVIAAAGNNGADTENYVPANVENAIVVSAVHTDRTLKAYSNHGASVDFAANGSADVRGIKNEIVSLSGTSVSAAIVSAIAAGIKAENTGISYSDLLKELEQLAEDIGEPGKDTSFGTGLLTLDCMNSKDEQEEEKQEEMVEEKLPELLTCDWKSMSTEQLNALINETDELYQKRFLDDLSISEQSELLAREDILYQHEHTAVMYDAQTREEVRFSGTLKEYLYSTFFDEYIVQAKAEKEYPIYNGIQPYWAASCSGSVTVRVCTCGKAANACGCTDKAVIRFAQSGGQPTNTYKVTISATDAESFKFGSMNLAGRFLSGDNNGHNLGNTPVPMASFVKGIKVNKEAHTRFTKQSRTKAQTDTRLVVGGFYKPDSETIKDSDYKKYISHISGNFGDNICKKTVSENVSVMISVFELSCNQIFTLEKTKYSSSWGEWGAYTPVKTATCSNAGENVTTRYKTCSYCAEVLDTQTQSQYPTQQAHTYVGKYDTSNGIVNGKYWEECSKTEAACGRGTDVHGEAWQKNLKYLQQVYYRLMGTDGKYPGYTCVINDYYAPGACIGAYGTADWVLNTCGGDFLPASNAVESYYVQDARVAYVDVPRKKYTVSYASSIAGAKNMPENENVIAGASYTVTDKIPTLAGYAFSGWTINKDGSGTSYKAGKSLSVTGSITLYAQWKKAVYTISLDNQGAQLTDEDTKVVYEKYDTGYFTEREAVKKFTDNKITIPEKTVKDITLLKGKRKQHFLGYYTKKNGQGHQMIKADGSLIANINYAGNYKYFTADSTVYAKWEDMSAIQFSDNLTDEDMDILSKDENGNVIPDPIINPDTQWKEKGKDITVHFEAVTIQNEILKKIYRLKGWSLTPVISNDDEIILSETKDTYTFTANEDVVLYAQWDTSFMVSYVGNEQTEGMDYMDEVKRVTDSYTFNPNDKEQVALLPNKTADYFVKTVEKPTIDIATGNAVDESGNPYMESVECSFQGWSMYSEWEKQITKELYMMKNGEYSGLKVILNANETALAESGKGLTFDAPVKDYGIYSALHSSKELIAGVGETEVRLGESIKGYITGIVGMPYINLYAVWDEYPQILASDMYFSLSDARSGIITEEYLLDCAESIDRELKSAGNPDGRIRNGEDMVNHTRFSILDYQSSEFLAADGDMAMTVTYRAEDAVGNVTTKMVNIYLVDTAGTEYEAGSVRFVSAAHIDTLASDSIWRTGEYATKLAEVLANGKTGEEYTSVTPVQQALGMKSVKKPGSGTWNHVEQVWEFTHAEVLAVQTYLQTNGLDGTQNEFLSAFKHCRIK